MTASGFEFTPSLGGASGAVQVQASAVIGGLVTGGGTDAAT